MNMRTSSISMATLINTAIKWQELYCYKERGQHLELQRLAFITLIVWDSAVLFWSSVWGLLFCCIFFLP